MIQKKSYKQNQEIILSSRIILGITIFLLIAAGIEFFQSGFFNSHVFTNIWFMLWAAILITALIFLLSSLTRQNNKFSNGFTRILTKLSSIQWFNLLMVGIICILFSVIILNPGFQPNQSFFSRLSILWLFSLPAAIFLKARFQEKKFFVLLLFTILFSTATYQAANLFRDLTTYLFSLAWSEGSRFYYASLPFSQNIYGQVVPWSFLHPSRYLLMSLPFIFGNLPIWVHRGWQIFLWISLTLLGCMAILRRLKLQDQLKAMACTAWLFIFLLQGPVYYHLMVCAILVLWGFDVHHILKSLLFTILASIWAGISRVNWFPLPAAMAILLYTLEKTYDQEDNFWTYIRVPILFAILGMSASLLAQAAYGPISGNLDPSLFATSFTSDLLWYRLLPSPTYPPGILTGLIILISPLLIFLILNFRKIITSMHWLRQLIILGILMLFLAGGLVVSVKIGGGSNLHNLDAFLLLFIIFCGYLIFNRIKKDQTSFQKPVLTPLLLASALVLVPVCWSLFNWEPFPIYDKSAAYQDLQRLTNILQKSSFSNKEVLFISDRHLLTLHYIKGIPLVPDYELLTLMEMAISNNQTYLNRFYTDLMNQRFALIVMDKQYVIFKDNSTAFPEENNAWVKLITIPIIEYYQPTTWLRSTDTEIYTKRNNQK